MRDTRRSLEDKYKLKVQNLGEGKDCVDEVRILKQIFRYTESGIELEADPRHAELVIKELGLENAKASRVPGNKTTDENLEAQDRDSWWQPKVSEADTEAETLDAESARRYRAVAARLNYLAVDRPDIQHEVKKAARAMSSPCSHHWQQLSKIGKYLLGRPRLIFKFPWQDESKMVTTYTDSDWAACVKAARSTSGGILTIGGQVVKTYAKQQKVIALSSAEAGLYAMVAASAKSFALIAYAKELGMTMTGEIYTDLSAAFGITKRCGIGKVRHLRTQGLWIQETSLTGRLKYWKVLGSKNPADIPTKRVPGELLERHLETLNVEVRNGRAESAPELNSVFELLQWHAPLSRFGGGKCVRFCERVLVRCIPADNLGRPCRLSLRTRAVRVTTIESKDPNSSPGPGGVAKLERPSWADMADEESEEFSDKFKDAKSDRDCVARRQRPSREGGAVGVKPGPWSLRKHPAFQCVPRGCLARDS